ncbi:MAG: methylmalonyl Co-A mutase-associated GTPase MeaB [Candidatus Thermoplasmatota archaeon]|nr:methylmalonyl Co-A mutase-associated GTPase MeaB [Candidatus Thermoplasmatota archaeon]MDA8142644.1 methylmalonyl Co-A mutase-associated GTPase MeaB [Thermoplasmatales archaeon]
MKVLKIEEIVRGILDGDRRAVSRGISVIENDYDSTVARRIIKEIFPSTGRAHIVGITGPPGIGKSTMIGNLSAMLSKKGFRVSVVAVDASSPFSGGSLLGNRIRMQESLSKYGVYMRSLANRGMNGGLSRSVWDAVKILDASGSDYIIVETVGAGQADLDIVNLAETVIVVLGPGLGDEIQAIKAGIMEIGHVFVINKMDRQGAFIAMKDIEETLAMSPSGEWKPPVVGVNSLTGEGYETFIEKIQEHGNFVKNHSGSILRKFRTELQMTIIQELRRKFESDISLFLGDNAVIERLIREKVDPYSAAEKLVKKIT